MNHFSSCLGLDHKKKQENSRKTSTSASLTMLKPLTVWITTNCGKLLNRREYQTSLPAFCKTCIHVKKQVRTRHGTTDRLKMGKGVCQGCTLSPWIFKLYAEYIMWNVGLHESQAGIKTARRNINNLRYADNITLMAKSKEELESLHEGERGAGLTSSFKKLWSWHLVAWLHFK